jgi:hypothetical protein
MRVSKILVRVTSESSPPNSSMALDDFETPSRLTSRIALRDSLAILAEWCCACDRNKFPSAHGA